MNKDMDGGQNNDGSLYMTIFTVFLYMAHRFTLSDWAAVGTIAAALSTLAYNLYRMFWEKKKGP
jgi:hypothetical protein